MIPMPRRSAQRSCRRDDGRTTAQAPSPFPMLCIAPRSIALQRNCQQEPAGNAKHGRCGLGRVRSPKILPSSSHRCFAHGCHRSPLRPYGDPPPLRAPTRLAADRSGPRAGLAARRSIGAGLGPARAAQHANHDVQRGAGPREQPRRRPPEHGSADLRSFRQRLRGLFDQRGRGARLGSDPRQPAMRSLRLPKPRAREWLNGAFALRPCPAVPLPRVLGLSAPRECLASLDFNKECSCALS